MHDGFDALTEREKETLRLLLAGHDAKSIARAQGLSVHTVNERLRDARRKLDVSSSREAARLLVEAERGGPDFRADKQLGVAGQTVDVRTTAQPQGGGHRLAWLGGGMLIMSLVIAAIVVSSLVQQGDAARTASLQRVPAPASAPGAAPSANAPAAREWLALVDGQRWNESWRLAAAAFRAQVPTDTWAAQMRQVRQPLGTVSSRALLGATRTNALPGAPAGEYEVLQFQTDFATKSGAVETVVLSREGSAWKVSGYFIR